MTTSKTSGQRQDSRPDIFGMHAEKIGADGKNDIGSRRVMVSPEPKRLANNPLEAVSLHRAANLPVDADPEPARTRGIRPADQGKSLTMQTPALAVHVLKLPAFSQQGAFQ
jgi:hypothetical protein